eukprot:g1942.t1
MAAARGSLSSLVPPAANPQDDDQARREFYERLDELHTVKLKGKPYYALGKPQKMKKPVDLYGLYHAVKEEGGYNSVSIMKQGNWARLAKKMNNTWPKRASLGYDARRYYEKHLLAFETDDNERAQERDQMEGCEFIKVVTPMPQSPRADDDEIESVDVQGFADNTQTLQRRVRTEIEGIHEHVARFNRKLEHVPSAPDAASITRVLLERVNEILQRALPGSRSMIFGRNGLGKSFLLDLILRAGCLTFGEYKKAGAESHDKVWDAVQDEANERHQENPDNSFDDLVDTIIETERVVQAPPKTVFSKSKKKLREGSPLADKKRAAVDTDKLVQKFCQKDEHGGAFDSFVLPSGRDQNSRSTTKNSIVIKRGSCWQLKVKYYSEDELRETFANYDWAGNDEDTDQADESSKFLHEHMLKWVKEIRSPECQRDNLQNAGASAQSSDSDDDSDSDADVVSQVMQEARDDEAFVPPISAERVEIHPDYSELLGKTKVYVGMREHELDDRVYIKSKLEEVLFGGREAALKECVLYAPCLLIPEGTCLVDTAGANDKDPTKQYLLQQELEQADTVLCVLEKGIDEDKDTFDWIKNERLLQRALGGLTMPPQVDSREEDYQRPQAERLMTASEKPVKLMFMVNYQEKHDKKTASGIAEADDDYADKKTETRGQQEAITRTKIAIAENYRKILGHPSNGMQERDIEATVQSALKQTTFFSCNPLLYVSLLTNRKLAHTAPKRETYHKALARSNGRRLLAVLDKCAANDDCDDRVAELEQFLEHHNIGTRIMQLSGDLVPPDVRQRFKAATKKTDLNRTIEAMHKEVEEKYAALQREEHVTDWMDGVSKALDEAVPGIIQQVNSKLDNFGVRARLIDMKNAFAPSSKGQHRKLKLKKIVKDALYPCLKVNGALNDVDNLNELAETCKTTLLETTVGVLRSKVLERIDTVAGRVAATQGSGSGLGSGSGSGSGSAHTPTSASKSSGAWRTKLDSVVDERARTEWKDSATTKLKSLTIREGGSYAPKSILKKLIDTCFDRYLLKDMSGCTSKPKIKEKFAENARQFVQELDKKLHSKLKNQWNGRLKAAFLKLAHPQKQNALLRTAYSDFMSETASSLNHKQYQSIGDELQSGLQSSKERLNQLKTDFARVSDKKSTVSERMLLTRHNLQYWQMVERGGKKLDAHIAAALDE